MQRHGRWWSHNGFLRRAMYSVNVGECIEEAEIAHRMGSANLKFGKRSISQRTINLLSHPEGIIS